VPGVLGVSNGEEGPKSSTKPVFLDELCHVMVVPIFTQNGAFPLAFGMSGVEDADVLPLRLMSTTQGEEADPHVVAAVHMLPGLVSEQMYLLFLPCCALAAKKPAVNILKNRSEPRHVATRCGNFIVHLSTQVRAGLVNAGRAFPIENIDQLPGVLIEINL
jgi:hypothetical protein